MQREIFGYTRAEVRTEIKRGESGCAPATSCHTPMAMVAASTTTATQCNQMSPAIEFCSRPFPFAVALNA